MERVAADPRADWPARVESQGLHYHTAEDGRPYWDESAYYAFSAGEVDELEHATLELDRLCLQAVEHVIANNRFDTFGVAPRYVEFVKRSWEHDELTVYGRFDFAYDGR